MIRRHVIVASASAVCLLVTSVGRAQAGDEQAPPPSDSDAAVAARQEDGADRERTTSEADGDRADDGNWMLAAGVSSSPYPDGVGPEVIIERRLSPRWWMLLGAEVIFGQSRDYQDDEAQVGHDTFLVGGGLGLRFVANPQDDFQFSAFGVLGGSYRTEEWEYYVDGSRGEYIQFGLAGRVGIALEMDIVDGFGVRLSTSLARLGYYMGTTDIGGLVSHESSGFNGGLSLRPGAALRFRF